ncbi:MAG: molecular chaperone HtpG, partial [Clostridia bacterium]|nr:molecular chaperone HtpG [Clostridia bacterium]
MKREGNIKISSENMMPIIKKWLYSDKDIFLREIVANGIDAITKFKKLVDMGEAQGDEKEYCVKISVDKKAKTLTVEDNGIGMTEEEVETYITQIAFSGASDFLSKYEKANGDGIIGHFGLGFYSAYMVSDYVEIFTKSHKESSAVHWTSDGNSTYSIEECDKTERGTKIVMHISASEKEFLDESNIKNLVKKYCAFMPFNVYVSYKGDGKDQPLNSTTPLYAKNPKDCTDEDYKNFYRDTFMDYNEPIFWVHLNMDYPFKLKGILYFPKVTNKVELERGKVKLYCNQVFIADNIKEVIPEFLMLLNGVIDCPDIPLNVSRSFLQNDRQVQKISNHITKKVADKLTALFKSDREKYESCWEDTANFIKFGCIKQKDFYDKVKD